MLCFYLCGRIRNLEIGFYDNKSGLGCQPHCLEQRLQKKVMNGGGYKGTLTQQVLQSPHSNYPNQPIDMDSFENISLPTSIPTDYEGGGGGNPAYCVVFQNAGPTETPANEEGGGGGNPAYCIVA